MSEPTARELADAIEDVGRMIARVDAGVARLSDAAKAANTTTDVPLLVELLALHGDVTACAATARSRRERVAFESVAQRMERLIAGRGGALVTPAADDPFDAATMQAAQTIDLDPGADPALHHTVESLLSAGLTVTGRSVRPARVVVRQVRPVGATPSR